MVFFRQLISFVSITIAEAEELDRMRVANTVVGDLHKAGMNKVQSYNIISGEAEPSKNFHLCGWILSN